MTATRTAWYQTWLRATRTFSQPWEQARSAGFRWLHITGKSGRSDSAYGLLRVREMPNRVPAIPRQPAPPEHHQPRTLREAYNELQVLEASVPWQVEGGAVRGHGSPVASGPGQAPVMAMIRGFGS